MLKGIFLQEQETKGLCLLKTNAEDDGRTCCNCSSCKMRRRRQDFSSNGPENGSSFLLLSSSNVYDFTDRVLMCCATPVSETGPESGESKPQTKASRLGPRCIGQRQQLQERQSWKRRKADSLPLE